MSQKRLLIQCQLSNYDTKGNFILEADSGWQMCVGRVREMLKLNPELVVTLMGPNTGIDGRVRQLITDPWDVNPDLWEKYGPDGEDRLHYFEYEIIANALVTRYDFDWTALAVGLNLGMQKEGASPKWDAVYLNDPMHLRNFKAMFHVVGGYQPKFFVHSHFIDNPENPKFPTEASLWLGQCEAALRADYNFWQCESSMNVFFGSMGRQFQPHIVDEVKVKSAPWDDGYSIEEITSPIDEQNLRFDPKKFAEIVKDKIVIFVPNRIGGRGRSSDYTNCGWFMFEFLPKLYQKCKDIVVIAGNPSQKFSNEELERECGPNGYVSLVPDAFNRDEYKFVARNSHIVVGLYTNDTYGGTASRECIELGCMPLWFNIFEYSSIAREVGGYPYAAERGKFMAYTLDLIDDAKIYAETKFTPYSPPRKRSYSAWQLKLKNVVRKRCSYEATTRPAMEKMGLL